MSVQIINSISGALLRQGKHKCLAVVVIMQSTSAWCPAETVGLQISSEASLVPNLELDSYVQETEVRPIPHCIAANQVQST